MKSTKKSLFNEKGYLKQDIAFTLLIFVFFVALLIFVHYGFPWDDEVSNILIGRKVQPGSNMISDEWHNGQWHSLFFVIPGAIYHSIVGSHEGIILFFRILYVIFKTAIAVFMYSRIRRCGYISLPACLIFLSYDAQNIMTISYYNMFPACLIVTCLLLFTKPEVKRFEAFIAGVFYAFAAVYYLSAGLTFVLFAIFFLVISIRNKKHTDKTMIPGLFSFKNLIFLFIGFCSVMLIILVFFISTLGISKLIQNLILIYTPVQDELGQRYHETDKIEIFTRFIPPLLYFLPLTLVIFSPILKTIFKKYRIYILLAGSLSILTCAIITYVRVYFTLEPYYLTHIKPLFIPLLGLLCLLLSDKKRPDIILFWILGVINTISMDVLSTISFGYSLVICIVPSLLAVKEIYNEIKKEESLLKTKADEEAESALKYSEVNETNKAVSDNAEGLILSTDRIARSDDHSIGSDSGTKIIISAKRSYSHHLISRRVLEALFCIFIIINLWYSIDRMNWFTVEERGLFSRVDFGTTIYKGPAKGIRTSEDLMSIYIDTINDLDEIPADKQRLFLPFRCSWANLYADLGNAAYSVDVMSRVRQEQWWELNPEKVPDVIYISYYDWDMDDFVIDKEKADNELDYLKTLCDCDIIEGKAGILCNVREWHGSGKVESDDR